MQIQCEQRVRFTETSHRLHTDFESLHYLRIRMSRVAIPLDSVAIVPASGGDTASRTWSEEFAREIARFLSADCDLRIVPAERTRAFAATGDYSPEEIGRHVDARCAVHCAVSVSGDALDVRVAIIDVLAESAVCETSYLSSVDEAVRVQEQIARWLSECCFAAVAPHRHEAVNPRTYARCIEAKVLRREGRFAEAIALIRGVAEEDRAALATFAEIVVDAPSRVLDLDTIAFARLASAEADDLVAARILCRFVRDWEAAAAAFARAVSRRGDPVVHAHYGLFLAAMRRFDEAEIELRIAAELSDPMMPERLLVERGLSFCGRGGQAIVVDHDRYAEAVAHALAEESEAALDALRDAAAVYSPHVMFAGVDPAFLALRGEQQFAEILRDLRL
jgi:tetratricopeptide (TPR) repeat protein